MFLNQTLSWIGFGLASSLFQLIPWSFIFLFTRFFNIHLYIIRKKEDCIRIQKNIGPCSHLSNQGRGHGYSIGFWYIAFLDIQENDHSEYYIWIVSTASTYKRLTIEKEIKIHNINNNNNNNDLSNSCKNIPFKIMERYGTKLCIYFRKRELLLYIKPKLQQQLIIDDIQSILKRKKSVVILIHGEPGVGKTMLSILLTNELRGLYCNSLQPWSPGESIATLYSDAEPSESSPLIIAFDEIDGSLERIHNGIESHKNLKICVQNKQGWNQMLDEVQMGFYPNLIIIMTTNKSPDFINNLDPSYIRNHRVDSIYCL
jgi:hypothetical protein